MGQKESLPSPSSKTGPSIANQWLGTAQRHRMSSDMFLVGAIISGAGGARVFLGSLLNQGLAHTRVWRRNESALPQDFLLISAVLRV